MGVLIAGVAVVAVLLAAGWWVAKVPQKPRAVLDIAVGVLTGAFLMQLTTARTPPRRGRRHLPAGESRDVAAPAVTGIGSDAQAPVSAEAAALPSRPEQVTARR
jgi:hypothetical protein